MQGNEMSMIFQDVMNGLNPVLTIGNQLTKRPGLYDMIRIRLKNMLSVC